MQGTYSEFVFADHFKQVCTYTPIIIKVIIIEMIFATAAMDVDSCMGVPLSLKRHYSILFHCHSIPLFHYSCRVVNET